MTFSRTVILMASLLVGGCSLMPPAKPLADLIAEDHTILVCDNWYGGRRIRFDFEGYEAWVVEPPAGVPVAEGSPWTWTMQWAGAFVPRTGVPQLLAKGWRHATIITFRDRMDANGLAVSHRFQEYLVRRLGFAPKANLIGMSWGGFFSVRYAAAFPDAVAKVYLDAPLLTFHAFAPRANVPSQSAERIGPWASLVPKDGWKDSPEMPLNKAETLAATKIPVLLLYGGQDKTVNPKENCEPFAARFKAAGGTITVKSRPLFGHHPHGVDAGDSTIVDFFTK